MLNVILRTILAAFLLACTERAEAKDFDVHIYFRSFIMNKHPSKPDDTIKTSIGTYVIKAPSLKVIPKLVTLYPSLEGTCFSTDDRGFDQSQTASARTTVEFLLQIRGREMSVARFEGREMARTGVTQNVDCASGKQLRDNKQATTKKFSIGDVKKSNFTRELFVEAAASDPFYTLLPAPSVDFNFTLTYDILQRKISIKGSTDDFPAFEGYYSINGGPIKPLLQRPPAEGATALSLFDLYLGLNTTEFEREILLK